MLFATMALIIGLIVGGIANVLLCPNVTVSFPVEPMPIISTAFEPTFTAYRDGEQCMSQFWTLDAAQAWASESAHFEIYSTVGNLITSR